jgi:hypothetical protein
MHPESHLRYHAERHADLLREARQVERVSSLGEMRRTRPKLMKAGLWHKRLAGRLSVGRA